MPTAAAYRRDVLIGIPLLLLVPLAFALWFHLWGISLSWPDIGAGALRWTVIEIVYTMGNGLAIASLLLRTDERARQELALLASMRREKLLSHTDLALVAVVLGVALVVFGRL
jgi:hypothetical protein